MDQRFAMIASILANIHRGEGTKPYEVWQFMPMDPKERARRQEEKDRREIADSQKKAAYHLRSAMAGLPPIKKPPVEISTAEKLTPEEQAKALQAAKTPAEKALAKAGIR